MRELLLALQDILEVRQRLGELTGRGDRAERVEADPSDLRDEFSRLQSTLGALAPRVGAADERVREALRQARPAWAAGAEAEPVREQQRLAAEYARLAEAIQGSE
jgi:hypothetical protein